MEILNVVEAELAVASIVFGTLSALLGVTLLFVAFLFILDKDLSAALVLSFAVIFALLSLAIFTEKTPQMYEVIITDPDYVIDATMYEIVGQRGEIYMLIDREEG